MRKTKAMNCGHLKLFLHIERQLQQTEPWIYQELKLCTEKITNRKEASELGSPSRS